MSTGCLGRFAACEMIEIRDRVESLTNAAGIDDNSDFVLSISRAILLLASSAREFSARYRESLCDRRSSDNNTAIDRYEMRGKSARPLEFHGT